MAWHAWIGQTYIYSVGTSFYYPSMQQLLLSVYSVHSQIIIELIDRDSRYYLLFLLQTYGYKYKILISVNNNKLYDPSRYHMI